MTLPDLARLSVCSPSYTSLVHGNLSNFFLVAKCVYGSALEGFCGKELLYTPNRGLIPSHVRYKKKCNEMM